MAKVRVLSERAPKVTVRTFEGMVLRDEVTSSSGSVLRPIVQILKRPQRKPMSVAEEDSGTSA